MDAAIASIITGIVSVIGSVIVAKINNRRKQDECVKHRKELEEKKSACLIHQNIIISLVRWIIILNGNTLY